MAIKTINALLTKPSQPIKKTPFQITGLSKIKTLATTQKIQNELAEYFHKQTSLFERERKINSRI